MNIQALQNIGLTEKEAAVYLTLLMTGTATASEISCRADVRRTTTYQTLLDLKAKKLITETIIDSVQKFKAESPDHLVDWCNEKFRMEQVRI